MAQKAPTADVFIRVRAKTRLNLMALRGHYGCKTADDVVTFLLSDFETSPKRRDA